LQNLSADTFDNLQEVNDAFRDWILFTRDYQAQALVKLNAVKEAVPEWSDELSKKNTAISANDPHEVIAIDGSQIYPDRHMGFFCSLINIGTVYLPYQLNVPVAFYSEPFLFINDDMHTIDSTNARRQEMELSTALWFEQHKPMIIKRLYLFDGSL